MKLYPNLRAEMARADMGVKDVAELVGVSQQTVYNWLSGTRGDFRIGEALMVAKKLGKPAEYLFGEEGEKDWT